MRRKEMEEMSDECMFCGDDCGEWGGHTPHEFRCEAYPIGSCRCDLLACGECCPTCNEWQFAVSACRSCGARIVWYVTKDGVSIPIDAEDAGGWDVPKEFPNGNLIRGEGRMQTSFGSAPIVEYVDPGEGKWQTHFASCKDAESWRKRR